jgi:hypothetical protein
MAGFLVLAVIILRVLLPDMSNKVAQEVILSMLHIRLLLLKQNNS